jgi:hypothetical protein
MQMALSSSQSSVADHHHQQSIQDAGELLSASVRAILGPPSLSSQPLPQTIMQLDHSRLGPPTTKMQRIENTDVE